MWVGRGCLYGSGVTVLSDLRVLSGAEPQDRGRGAFALLSPATWAVDQPQDWSCPSDTAESARKLSRSTSGEAAVAVVRTQGGAASLDSETCFQGALQIIGADPKRVTGGPAALETAWHQIQGTSLPTATLLWPRATTVKCVQLPAMRVRA